MTPIRFEADIIPTSGGGARGGAVRTCDGTSNKASASFPNWVINSMEQTIGVDYTTTGNGVRLNFTTSVTGGLDQDALTIIRVRMFYASGTPEDGEPC